MISVKNFIYLIFLTTIYLFAWNLQNHFLLKGDLSWQMHMSRLVFNGGTYVKDFFEINPPLSIYLYMPAIFIEKMLGWSSIIAMRSFIFLLASLSLVWCYFLLKKIVKNNSEFPVLVIAMLAVVFLILPLHELGQRENLILYLTFPYFLLLWQRVLKQPIPIIQAVSIGVAAGLGFAIKPFYLGALVLLELYFILKQKNLLAWMRPEIFSIGITIISYLIFIYVFHPEYIHTIVPIASHFYYSCFGIPVGQIIFNPLVMFIGLTSLFYFLKINDVVLKSLLEIWIICLLAFLILYIVQRIPWFYHIMPALSMAIIIVSLVIGFIFRTLKNNFVSTSVAVVLLVFPVSYLVQIYNEAANQKTNLTALINEIHDNAKDESIYFFSSQTAYMVSVLEHARANHASRLQFLWWMKCYLCNDFQNKLTHQQKADEDFLIEMLAEDIKNNKPKFIYVDTGVYKTPMQSVAQIDYLKILSSHPGFKEVWQAYHFIRSEESKGNYRFDVYGSS